MDNDKCPKCQSDNINWDSFELIDATIGFFEATCDDCGYIGRQWNELKFQEWVEWAEDDSVTDHDLPKFLGGAE